MVDEGRHSLGGQHVQGLDAGLDALLRSVSKATPSAASPPGSRGAKVADDEQRLATRLDHEAHVTDRVRAGHRLHARDDVLAVGDEYDAIAVRQQVLLASASEEPSAGVPIRLSSVQKSRSAWVRWICALGKLRLPSSAMMPPMWSMCAWVGITASMSLGSMPASLRLAARRPIRLSRLTELMPVSNTASLSPVLMTSALLVEHHVVGRQEMVDIIAELVGALGPRKVRAGSPIDSGPSDTTVASMLPSLNR